MDACSMQSFFAEIDPFLAELLIKNGTASSQKHAPRGVIWVISADLFFVLIFFLFDLKKKGMPV